MRSVVSVRQCVCFHSVNCRDCADMCRWAGSVAVSFVQAAVRTWRDQLRLALSSLGRRAEDTIWQWQVLQRPTAGLPLLPVAGWLGSTLLRRQNNQLRCSCLSSHLDDHSAGTGEFLRKRLQQLKKNVKSHVLNLKKNIKVSDWVPFLPRDAMHPRYMTNKNDKGHYVWN